MKELFHNILIKCGCFKKPDFLIIGAQKGGTSGLFSTLAQHTCITTPSVKEIHYFDNDDWYNKGQIDQYHSFFPLPTLGRTKTFEASPLYVFHPRVAERLYAYNPNLKLILLLREPASRAFSAWVMYHHFFNSERKPFLHDPRPFPMAIAEEIQNMENESYYDNTIAYVKRGIYFTQIQRYLSYFKRDQLLILESNSLSSEPDKTLKLIQDFIGVKTESLTLQLKNMSAVNQKEAYKSDILQLKEFYQPYNRQLFSLIGDSFDWE